MEKTYIELKRKYDALAESKVTESAYLELADHCKEKINEKNDEIDILKCRNILLMEALIHHNTKKAYMINVLHKHNKRLIKERDCFLEEWKETSEKLTTYESNNIKKTKVTSNELVDIPKENRIFYELE